MLEFVPCPGQTDKPDFKDHLLVIPTHAAGLSAFIGTELFVLNEGMTKLGYIKSPLIGSAISNDGLSISGNEGAIVMPCEIYHQKE